MTAEKDERWMMRNRYLQILGRLPITGPTKDDMVALCPHLRPDEAVAAWQRNGVVYCPTLRVAGSFHVMRHTQASADASRPALLNHVKTERLPSSRAGMSAESARNGLAEAEAAVNFAMEAWGGCLVDDSWADVVEIQLIEKPYRKRGRRGLARTARTTSLYAALNRELNCLMAMGLSAVDHIDEATVELTVNPLIGQEIIGVRSKWVVGACASCGTGINNDGCRKCGWKLKDSSTMNGRFPLVRWTDFSRVFLTPRMRSVLVEAGLLGCASGEASVSRPAAPAIQ